MVLLILTFLVLSTGRTPPSPPLPNPNGYDDFLNAAALLTGDVGNASTSDHDSLRALVSTNSETLRLLRLGLTRDCSVPTDSAITGQAKAQQAKRAVEPIFSNPTTQSAYLQH